MHQLGRALQQKYKIYQFKDGITNVYAVDFACVEAHFTKQHLYHRCLSYTYMYVPPGILKQDNLSSEYCLSWGKQHAGREVKHQSASDGNRTPYQSIVFPLGEHATCIGIQSAGLVLRIIYALEINVDDWRSIFSPDLDKHYLSCC